MHRHVVGLVFTGPDMPDGEGGHYHMVPGGLMTSTDEEGPKHTHTVGELTTSGPLPVLGPEGDGPHMEDEAKKKKSKKKGRKPKKPSGGWGY